MSTLNSLSATQPDLNATVTASAGSGKTWLLITRIIRLLLAGAEPGSILALTFTRKAAAEMQMRLHERLYEMAITDDDNLVKLLEGIGAEISSEVQQKARSLYEDLLHHLYPVRLQTFHSFCQDILSRFPLEADVPPGFELMEESSLLEQQAWEALFAEATKDPESPLADDLDYLMQTGNGPSNTRKSLASMLSHRSDWWAYTENHASPTDYAIEQLQQQLQLIDSPDPVVQFFDHNKDLLNEFALLLRQHKTATNFAHAAIIENMFSQNIFDNQAMEQLKTVFLTAQQQPRARKASKAQEKSMSAAGQDRYLELHENLCVQIQQTLDALLRLETFKINQAWYRAGHRFIEIFQRLKRELRMLDFTDLEWNCYRLLNTSDNALWIQYKVDQRIDHFLIDEFQDTNPTQWQLLSPLLEEMAANPNERWRSVFLVGDEKQSIYSFRRANPALQSQASLWLHDHLSAHATPLDDSWRSSPAIIEFVNQVFRQEPVLKLMPSYKTHGTHLKNRPGKVSVFPLYEEAEEETENAPTTRVLRNPLLEPRAEIIASARKDEAENIADHIQQLITTPLAINDGKNSGENTSENTRAVTYGDIMILIRNRTHIDAYEKALRESGIPFIGSQRGTLLDSLEIQDLEKLLDTLITPFDNLAIAQVLKSPLFDATDDDLILLAQIRKTSHWYERLQLLPDGLQKHHPLMRAARLLPRWRQLVDTVPVHDLLDRIYAESNIQQRYTASVADSYKQRVQANLQRFLELSLELDSGRYPSLSHFLHYLRSLRKPEASAPDEPVINAGESRVRLMTIHASKGLESPVVFLADCDSGGSAKDAFTALVHWPADAKKPERLQLVMSKDKTDSITEGVQQKKSDAQAREQLNLLYVALTRAREHLYISGVTSKRSSSGWHQLVHNAMTSIATEETNGMLSFAFGQHRTAAATGKSDSHNEDLKKYQVEIKPELNLPIKKLPAMETMIAPSRANQHQDISGITDEYLDSEHGQTRGIAIHRALDLLSRKNRLSEDDVLQQLASEMGLNTADSDLNNWLREAVETTKNVQFEEIFTQAESRQSHNELPLLYEANDRPVYGVIDRLVITEKEILLIDYKTHAYVTRETAKTTAELFKEQMRLYREGVERIWPDQTIRSGLLFTACAELIWLNQSD